MHASDEMEVVVHHTEAHDLDEIGLAESSDDLRRLIDYWFIFRWWNQFIFFPGGPQPSFLGDKAFFQGFLRRITKRGTIHQIHVFFGA